MTPCDRVLQVIVWCLVVTVTVAVTGDDPV